jgi:hypothetical protein
MPFIAEASTAVLGELSVAGSWKSVPQGPVLSWCSFP